MVRLFKHYAPHAVLRLGLIDCAPLLVGGPLRVAPVSTDSWPYRGSLEVPRHELDDDLIYAKYDTPVPSLRILLQALRMIFWPGRVR
jgi:hypothetical protein